MNQQKYRRGTSATREGDEQESNTNQIVDSPSMVSSRNHLIPIPELSSVSPVVESPPVSGQHHQHYGRQSLASQDSFTSSKSGYSTTSNTTGSGPQPGTYVVQVPRDQIYRVPPPENAHKFKLYTRRNNAARRSCCRSFCLALVGVLILLATAGVIFYVIYRPTLMSFSVERFHVHGFNLTSSMGPTDDVIVSPVFNTTVKVKNRNDKIGIYYQTGSSVKVYHNGVNLCDGKLPSFYQAPKNATIFITEINGSGIVLSKLAREKLLGEVDNGKVPFKMDVEMPFKMKVGAVKTWTITVQVSCKITVNELTAKAKVLEKNCKAHAKPW